MTWTFGNSLLGRGGFVVNLVAAKVIRQHMLFFFTLTYFLDNNLWNKKNMIVLVHEHHNRWPNVSPVQLFWSGFDQALVGLEMHSYSNIGSKTQHYCMANNIGLLNWYWWILAWVGCKNARTCECILKLTNANIHQYQFNNSFIIQQKHFSVNLHELWVTFIPNSMVEWWYSSCVKVCNIGNRNAPQFKMLPVK